MFKYTSKCTAFITLAENAFIIAFLVLSYEHKNGFVSAFVLQQLPLYEAVASANKWQITGTENEQKKYHLDELNEHNSNNSSKIVVTQEPNFFIEIETDLNETDAETSTTSSTNKSSFSTGDAVKQQQQEEKFTATPRMYTIMNLSTKHQKRDEKSSESMVDNNTEADSKQVTNPPFNHFHPLGFLSGVRHQNMLRKIHKLTAKGFYIF